MAGLDQTDHQPVLADRIRGVAPSIALAVTEAFLDRHPDWKTRFGSRALPAGVQDAGYHLAFLSAALDAGHPENFAAYARWAGGVLQARGIAPEFLAENLLQIRDAAVATVGTQHGPLISEYVDQAVQLLSGNVHRDDRPPLALAAQVYLQACLDGQRHAATSIARETLRGGSTVTELYLDVLQPVLYEVGAQWEANRITVAQEHMATAITQYVMAQVYQPPPPPDVPAGRLLLAGVEGEMHSVGAVMVGDLVETGGWEVRFLGTNVPAASVLVALRDWRPSHVGIGATMAFNLPAVRQLITAIRAEPGQAVTIVVGGGAFRAQPDAWHQVGGDAFAADLRAAQRVFAGRR